MNYTHRFIEKCTTIQYTVYMKALDSVKDILYDVVNFNI